MKMAEMNNKVANRMLYISIFVGVLPIFFICLIYLHNNTSPALTTVASAFSNVPAVTSIKNPLMTKVMDIYCKTAPVFAFILFLVSTNKRKIMGVIDRNKLIRAVLLTPFLCLLCLYIFLFRNFELTTAGRPARYLSGNDFSLLLFYVFFYIIVFSLSYTLYLSPVVFFKLYKGRR